jgi:hypothetical protein
MLDDDPNRQKFIHKRKEIVMSFLEEAEKIAGAVAAVEGMKKLDPNASFLTEAAAAVTGFEATGGIVEHFEKKEDSGQ